MHYRFGHDRLAVFDPEAIKCVLNDTSTYGKNLREYRMLKMFIGDGLVTQQGDIHALHRKLINPAFKFSSLKGLVSMFSQTTDNLIARWQTDIKENGGSAEVGVHDGFMKLTLDIIGKAAFGLDFESLTDDTTTLGAQASAVFLNMQETKISPVMRMLFFQYPGVFSNMSRLPVGLGARRQKILAFVDGLVRDVVAAKRKIIAEEGPERDCSAPDLLDLLLAGEGSDQLTDDEIVQHSKTFLFAGHHTTASLLTWVYYCLVDKPEILAKLRREIKTVIGDRKEITNEDLKALTYVNAVIRETLRIYSPVAKVTRSVDKDTSLLGQTVPAGTVLDLCLCATHMDPKYWTDPEAFNPERWMPGGEAQTHSHSYLPFLLGTRNCIGQKFSMVYSPPLFLLSIIHRSRTYCCKLLWC